MYSFKTLHAYYPSIDTDVKETYILGDFNINMYENNKYIVYEKKNKVCTKFAYADAKKYHQYYTINGLKQPVQCPTRLTCSTSTLIDHISASYPSRVQKFLKSQIISLFFVHEKFLDLKQVVFKSTKFSFIEKM